MLRILIAASMAVALTPMPSAAEGKGKGKHKAKDKATSADVVLVFADRDREAVRAYWVQTHGRGKCPPGLAKKRNGCLPPGQAKKRYVIGQRLPATVVVQPMPVILGSRLGRAPAGYEYAVVDGDLLKLAVGTRLVVDAISSMVD